jgi:hypothetical protein
MQKAWSTIERIERLDTKPKKATDAIVTSGQICVTKAEGKKNLAAEIQKTGIPPRSDSDNKGKLLEFAWKMQQDGYSLDTICGYNSCLKGLTERGANLTDPETVRTALAKEQKWGQSSFPRSKLRGSMVLPLLVLLVCIF